MQKRRLGLVIINVRALVDELTEVKTEYEELKHHVVKLEKKYERMLSVKSGCGDGEINISTRLQLLTADLFNNSMFSDIDVMLQGGTQVKAHKLILAASGNDWGVEQFDTIDMLDLTDMRYEVCYAMIKWVYTDEFDFHHKINDEFLIELMQAASICKLESLFIRCQKALLAVLNSENYDKILKSSEELSADILYEQCLKFNGGQHSKMTVSCESDHIDDIEEQDEEDLNSEEKIIECDNHYIEISDINLVNVGEAKSSPSNQSTRTEVQFNIRDPVSQLQVQQLTNDNFEILEIHENSNTNLDENLKLYTCDVCSKSFELESLLQSHQTVHKNKNCVICGKEFRQITSYKNHVEKFKEEPHWFCRLCPKIFKSEDIFLQHQCGEQFQSLLCGICGKVSKRANDHEKHMRTHTGEKPYKCDVCSKSFSQISNLNVHALRHTGEKKFKCVVCGRGFLTKSCFEQHFKLHSESQVMFRCDVCGKELKKNQSYLRHMKTHKNKQEFQCHFCGMPFDQKSMFDSHMETFPDNNHCSCLACLKVFTNKQEMHSHACAVKNVNSKINDFECDICQKSFGSKQYLKQHILTKHEGIEPYHCDICNKSFKSMFYYAHMKIHTGETKYKCHICNKATASISDLRRHIRSHTGERICTCEICGKNFKSKSNLNSHRKSHSDTRPAKCDVCGKSFRDNSDLTIHKRIHTGEKPYQCSYCDAAFRSTSALNSHAKSHFIKKPIERTECNICKKTFSTIYNYNSHVKKKHKDIIEETSTIVPTDMLETEYSSEIAIYTSYT